ncbi:MAG: diguanylate cyclase [bacterium]|nr:MAG: diguanylate cyclase [bacterium]
MSEKSTDSQARILVVEDNANLNEILCKIMSSEDYEPVSVLSGKDALDKIQAEGPFDLVLLDVMLPDPDMPVGMGIDGLEVCRRIKSHPDLQDTLIFMVTVKDQPEDIMKGIDAGADDYITKPFNTTLLLAKIKAMLRIKHLQDELREKNRQLEEMAVTDGLTGIPNYRHLIDKLDEEIKRSKRYQTPITMILIDLDNFKEVNDTYGHRHGDFVLKKVAKTLVDGLRETDIMARYGGDEFALLLPQTDSIGGERVAQQVMERLSRPFVTNDKEHRVKASIGLVSFAAGTAENYDQVIVAADTALYKAKELGGNQIYSHPTREKKT